MLSHVFSSGLSPQQALELTNLHLENALKTKDPELALTCCDYAEVALSRMKRPAKKTAMSSLRAEDQALRDGIATAYYEIGKLLASLGNSAKAQASYKKAEKWGRPRGRFQESIQSTAHPDKGASLPARDLTKDHPAVQLLSSPRINPNRDIAPISPKIFAHDMYQPQDLNTLPKPEERLKSISQLAYCFELFRTSGLPEDALDQPARKWLKAIEQDTDEQERLKMLATNMLREFARDELKDAKAVAEVMCLVPVLEKDDLQHLLLQIFHGIEQTEMLDCDLLEGLAQLVQRATPGHINADNLVKILKLISTRLQGTHGQSPEYINQLTLTVSHVLDSMADSKIKGLDRVELHEPLTAYLDGLKSDSDPYLVFQAAYAFQALLYVPDNETPWQATVRRTGKVVKGVSGLVSAVKGLDLNGFVEGLGNIQEGLAGVSQVFTLLKSAYDDVGSLAEGGQDFLDCMKEGFSISRKRAWYQALRGADVFLQNGQLTEFKKLVCEVPCRRDPAFQWGVCQRLGEIAANPECDDDSRNSAALFLGEIYQNDVDWGQQPSIKQWILDILMQLTSSSENALQAAETLLQELEKDGDVKKQALYQACRTAGPGPHPLRVALPPTTFPSLFDRVQNKPDVEASLRQLRERRLEGREKVVFISPQAKSSIQARDDVLFPLMDKVREFLDSNQKVFLVQGDSGAGKSTFNRQLECDLWNIYKKKDGRIPLFISLAAIEKPEHELIAKQLRKEEFTEPQIRELKGYREFILICDGYDESQQTHNLYMSNRLNELGGWRAQMVISCRSEYLGSDYRDRFRPTDRNHQEDSALFQEAVISPFSKDQVQEYVRQFVAVEGPLWQASDYLHALDQIPSLQDLVTNPFLLSLSLDVLPRMVDPGQNLSATRVTRVALYDQFMEQWLERGKKRLIEKVIGQEKKAFESLSGEGFTQNGIVFLKRLAAAIYEYQAGNPVVEYSFFRDRDTWKEAFFSREDEKQLLREACPLSRNGNQHRFIHRSLLEYSLARAVFEPQEGGKSGKKIVEPTIAASRRGSFSSAFSFESQDDSEEQTVAIEQPILESPLGRKSFVGEPSILQFLVERVHQEPLFKKQLLAVIERSKSEEAEAKTVRRAAANAITILVRAGVQFNGADLQGIQIPGADLSYGVFESAQMQGTDMRKVTLRTAWLREANLSKVRMGGVQFGELPFLKEDSAPKFCAYSPDGETLAVCLDNGDISIYTTSTWTKRKTLDNTKFVITNAVYSPKGDQIAITGRTKNTIRLWDIEAGIIRLTLSDHSDWVQTVTFSPNGDQIASGSEDMTVRLWDSNTGSCLRALTGHTDAIISLAYSPNGDQIASGGNDNTIFIWNVKTGVCLLTLSGHSGAIRNLVYSPKGDRIVSRSSDEILRLWDTETGDCCHILNGHSKDILSVAYSPKGDQIASSGQDNTVRLWDVETGDCRYTLTGHSDIVTCVVFSPKADQISSCSYDNTVRLWDTETGICSQILTGHTSWIRRVVYSPKGDQIATGSQDKTVRLWDVEAGPSTPTFSSHSGSVRCVVYSPNGDLIASGSADTTVRLWEVGTGACRHILTGHSDEVLSVAYSPIASQIASGSYDTTVRLWDVETRFCSQILIGHGRSVQTVVYSPDGREIASGSTDHTVRLWDMETGNCRHALTGHGHSVNSIAYSPSGRQIASGADDNTVRLWDVETGSCLQTLSDHGSSIKSIVYSPSGDQIASASYDETVRLWDVETGCCHHTLTGHSDSALCVAYSSKGGQIASGGSDNTVRLWDVGTGSLQHTLRGHSDEIHIVAYSPHGDQVASGSWDNSVRLWDAASGQCRAVVLNHGSVYSVAWKATSNGTYLVVGCADRSVRLWRVIEEEDVCSVRLQWRSPPDVLTVIDTSMEEVQGLSRLNTQLLKQRGAVGDPTLPLSF